MYEKLKGQIIDKTKAEFNDFPSILNGQRFDDYQDGWITTNLSPQIEVKNYRTITKLQCYYQAKAEGLWDNIQAALNGSPEFKIQWELSTGLDITHPSVKTVGALLGKNDEELQTFFNDARGRKS